MGQSNHSLSVPTDLSFESLKKLNQHGVEHWSARDLQPCLGYSNWRDFKNAIKKAKKSCEQSGNNPQHHFADVRKPIPGGKGSSQMVEDYHLSRFACYLIAQNGDPRKAEIAQAQKYFAIQTRRQEISDQMAADLERLEIREQATIEFKALSGAAREAGVQDKMFGIFHDAGYKGLYGGLGVDAIKARKGIPSKENLMDRMGTNPTCPLSSLRRVSETGNLLRFVRRQGELPWLPHESCILPVSLTRLREDRGQVGLLLNWSTISFAWSKPVKSSNEKVSKIKGMRSRPMKQ